MREVAPRLWIGNAFEARDLSKVLGAEIEAIVDLAIEEPPASLTREIVYCRIPIIDGSGNPLVRLRLAIETISTLVSFDVRTLVVCSAGMSRSPAFVAASMSLLKGITLDEALRQISGSGPSDVSPALLAEIATALECAAD